MAGTGNPIAEAVRAADHDRYLSALYAPPERREALLALYAFNVEIAGVRDRIREPLAGEMRLQWWRDTIANRQPGTATGHPIADALNRAIDHYQLPDAAFENYLEARIFDLYDDPMPSRTDLEGYCGETDGLMLQLSAMILDREAAPSVADLAGHAGCALGIAGILRKLPLSRSRGQSFIPHDVLEAAGATPEAFQGETVVAAAGRVVEAMVALASEHLEACRPALHALPRSLRPAFLPIATVPAWLKAASGKGARLLREPAEVPAWKRQLAIFRAAATGW
ncbi:phytoene/squalene synthase family protein [Pseudaminobacter sp. 19-2017]|uniref:Phytoene/squalene synthase family protein n=1 Tax=Pseudaminobacter soli (ex Zhang et al. 2022) TaxID=2831468 RepID=A0A942DYT1_9HYPH|nr:phytoene/squalene synthase family protein [Pseudaminobacter soli]